MLLFSSSGLVMLSNVRSLQNVLRGQLRHVCGSIPIKNSNSVRLSSRIIAASSLVTFALAANAPGSPGKRQWKRVIPPKTSTPNASGVTVVETVEQAKEVVGRLMDLRNQYHAWDTETTGLGHADRIICLSAYLGPNVDLGNGPDLWVDVLEDPMVLSVFQEYFADMSIKKVWHNYVFDRRFLIAGGVSPVGFGGDTFHMARFYNASIAKNPKFRTSKKTAPGYSLEALCNEYLGESKHSMNSLFPKDALREEIQRNKATRAQWIKYSTTDARMTWNLHEFLKERLERMPAPDGLRRSSDWPSQLNMYNLYWDFWRPVGALFCEMEHAGVPVDKEVLRSYRGAIEDFMAKSASAMRGLVEELTGCEDAKLIDLENPSQRRYMLFGPVVCMNGTNEPILSHQQEFELTRPSLPSSFGDAEDDLGDGEEVPSPLRSPPGASFGLDGQLKTKIVLRGLGLPVTSWTESGQPESSMASLEKLAGSVYAFGAPQYGPAYAAFERRQQGLGQRGCRVLADLSQAFQLKKVLKTLSTWEACMGTDGRMHGNHEFNDDCHVSSRFLTFDGPAHLSPLINGWKSAVATTPGKSLLLARYPQLRLRVLAHLSACPSLLEAATAGEDIHAHTAASLFEDVYQAMAQGRVVPSLFKNGVVPSVKEMYEDLWRIARETTYGALYGISQEQLAAQCGFPNRKDAKLFLERWKQDRPQVQQWQEQVVMEATARGYVSTLLGRRFPVLELRSSYANSYRTASLNLAMSVPVKGGAADITIGALRNLFLNKTLRELRWSVISSTADGYLLEGDAQSAPQAEEAVLECMRVPLGPRFEFSVPLCIAIGHGRTWAEAQDNLSSRL